jgi:metallo-beta-lactamase class B
MNLSPLTPALAALALLAPAPKPAVTAKTDAPFPAHRIAGNLYYVGSKGISSYLITTPKGHILIDCGFAATVPLIQKSVAQLGFKFTDVRILLTSHAHDDHVGGTALVHRLTHAKVMVMTGDDDIVRTGGKGDFQYNSKWEPCEIDKVLHDGDKVELGGMTLTAHLTPGHTRGCTTWTFDVKDGKKTLRAVIIGSPNVNPGYKLVKNDKYPQIAEDYARGFKVLKSLPCDLFLGAHGNYYGLEEKYKKLKAGGANPFVDPEGYQAYVSERQEAFERELAKQKGP